MNAKSYYDELLITNPNGGCRTFIDWARSLNLTGNKKALV